MRILSEKIQTLQALYLRLMRLLLSAEEMIAIKAPYLTERATDDQLRQVLRKQTEEGEARAARLRDMLNRAGSESAAPIKCKVIYALFDEAEELVEDAAHDAVRDAVLIAETQRIKHYEIAVYGALRQFARVLGCGEDERLLNETIHEESGTDKQLSTIAERVNPAAIAA